jgi:hypothetical protein
MISLVFAAALLAGAPVENQPAEPPPAATSAPAAAPAPKAKPNRSDMICKREAVLGSRLPTRVCLTREGWDSRRAESRDELTKIQRGQPYQSN